MFIRDFLKIVLTSSLISAGLVFFFFQWPSPPKVRASIETRTVSPEYHKSFTDEEETNIQLYADCSPGVVNITSTTLEYTWFFEVVPRQGVGSGLIIDEEGHIVTNYHVIQNAKSLDVTLQDKSKYEARRVGIDPVNDIAILKIDCPVDKLHPIPLGSSRDLEVGQKVLAIGNPFGLEGTLTTGIISSLERTLKTKFGIIDQVIQTDAAINPGNSGGPLLDTRGQVIGINTAIFSRTGESAGIGFAVPVATLKRILPDLIEYGRVIRPWFGVLGRGLTPHLAKALNLPLDSGFLVEQLERGSSAHNAGIRGGRRRVIYRNYRLQIGGDVITSLGGIPVNSLDDIKSILEDRRPGETIAIRFLREGIAIEKTMELLGEDVNNTLRF